MALKGSRSITVREQKFRWKYKGQKDRWNNSPRYPHVAVQEDQDKAGRPMIAWLESKRWTSHDLDLGDSRHRAMVTPNDIRILIEHCLDLGWDPSSKKGQFDCPGEVDLADYQTYTRDL